MRSRGMPSSELLPYAVDSGEVQFSPPCPPCVSIIIAYTSFIIPFPSAGLPREPNPRRGLEELQPSVWVLCGSLWRTAGERTYALVLTGLVRCEWWLFVKCGWGNVGFRVSSPDLHLSIMLPLGCLLSVMIYSYCTHDQVAKWGGGPDGRHAHTPTTQ